MKRIFYLMIALTLLISLLTTTVSAASTAPQASTPELGQLKVCKVAGEGVTEGQLFTIKVGNNSFSVPAGPGGGGYCVLAGQYPVDTEVTIQEVIPAGYFVSHIEAKPDRAVSKDVAQGITIIKVGSGVTEIIFTNRVIGSPTPTHEPTPLVTFTPKPTKTPTTTPDCSPNCTPTSTPIPRGRLQICKEADGAGVSGYFTFRFAGRSVSIPAGACSGLIGVDAGTLTISEEAQAGYVVTEVYTIPADRLRSEDLNARNVTVTIVQGNAATQTIAIFRNRAVTPTNTSTPTTGPGTVTSTATLTNTPITHTPTNTPTNTPVIDTPTFTPTNTPVTHTPTPTACVPTTVTVTPDISQIAVGGSVEGLGTVHPWLDIQAKGAAVHVVEGVNANPAVYASQVNGVTVFNAGMVAAGGFSDPVTQSASGAHQYTFTFAPGVTISNFTLHMLDFGDFNPTLSPSTLVSMTAYNASNVLITSQQLSYTSDAAAGISPVYGDLSVSGDANTALPQQPGNWTWNVSGTGITRISLDFGVGHDPNIGFDLLSFTATIDCSGSVITPTPTNTPITNTPTPTACVPMTVTVDPDFSQIPVGGSVEGLGTVHPYLNIDAKDTAVHIVEGENADPAVYASQVNGVTVYNAGMVASGGFSDPTIHTLLQPHQYIFTFAPGVSVSNFSLHMLDFGDFNPTLSPSTLVSMTAYNASNVVVASQQLSYTSDAAAGISPVYGDLSVSGDANTALPQQPGNWTWNVSGSGIVRVVLEEGSGYDPNVGFDLLSFTATVDCSGSVITPTPTPTNTPSACVPMVVDPDFSPLPVGTSIEGLGAVQEWLDIQAKGTAEHVVEGVNANPAVYASTVNGVTVFNAGMVAAGGFSDPVTQSAGAAHQYTFTFAPGVTISNFTLHMLDFGDFNPTLSPSHLVSMTAYNASNVVVTSQQLSYTTDAAGISLVYGDLSVSGDANTALPQQPGNWTWDISGTGIVRIALDFGVGHDPNMGLDIIGFTVECQ
jgi:hypothetical protein